jgi:hypothetical protein
LEDALPSITSFTITDNGDGFNEANRTSFDTLYSDKKLSEGGKGFGRFTCLKYFTDLKVDSHYKESGKIKRRTFVMGKENDIIVNETFPEASQNLTGSAIVLDGFKGEFPDKKLSTLARTLVEKLLPYFITKDYSCPKISIVEQDNSEEIILNNYLCSDTTGGIKEVVLPNSEFSLKAHSLDIVFLVRLFKVFSPKSQKSKICLVAHKRSVTETAIHNYIPEFIDEFYETIANVSDTTNRNFIIKAYVFSDYLDANVALERGGI